MPNYISRHSGEQIDRVVEQAILKSGGNMTGPLVLAADPVEDLEAATKQYVDNEYIPIPDGATEGQVLTYFNGAWVGKATQAKITGPAGDFVVIGADGNVTTKTILIAEEATF